MLRVQRRRYQLQHRAIELFFKGSSASVLYALGSDRDRDVVWRSLSSFPHLHSDEMREWEKVCAAWRAGMCVAHV
jgi:hypothetical protein